VLQLGDLAPHEFQSQRANFKLQLDAFRSQIEESQLVLNAPKLPVLVRVVHATGLQHGHGRELCGGEVDLAGILAGFGLVAELDVVGGPLLLGCVPNSNLERCNVITDEHVVGDFERNLDWVVNGVALGFGEGEVVQALLNWQHLPHYPL
jgi:hypothetical protein